MTIAGGNGVAERFIRDAEGKPALVRHFETIENLCLALLDFAAWYNTHWLDPLAGRPPWPQDTC